MKFLLNTISICVLRSLATPSTSVESLQQIQQEIEQLKRSNEESVAVIAALKETYDEKIRTQEEEIRIYDVKIASLERQLRTGKTHALQTGPASFTSFYLILLQNL